MSDKKETAELDEYGFFKGSALDEVSGGLKHSRQDVPKHVEDEWVRAREEYAQRGTTHSARKLATTVGIPPAQRPWAWQLLSGALELRAEHSKNTYQALARDAPDPQNAVHTQIGLSSTAQQQATASSSTSTHTELDLPRTFPTHAFVSSTKGFAAAAATAATTTTRGKTHTANRSCSACCRRLRRSTQT